MAVIETKELTYTYPGATRHSIEDISIKIEKGEFTLITGPSGCGKTTLCRCFNGLIPHFYQGEIKGQVFLAGLNVADHQIYELAKHAGLVFQNPENQLFALKTHNRRIGVELHDWCLGVFFSSCCQRRCLREFI